MLNYMYAEFSIHLST